MTDAHPRRGRRGLPVALTAGALVLILGVGGYIGVRAAGERVAGPRCEFRVAERTETFTPEQAAHAATISGIAARRGLPPRAATIALATAIQESKLRNIAYGDRDSLGLFQQRPSQGWGTEAQVQDPIYATNAFYDALVRVDGWRDGVITEVAQAVQRSGYPEAYADHEWEGRVLASVLTGHVPGGMGCRLDEPDDPSSADEVADKVGRQLGVEASTEHGRVVVPTSGPEQAWTVGTWAVAHAEAEGITSVTVGDRSWSRGRDESAWQWQDATRPTDSATTVRIELP